MIEASYHFICSPKQPYEQEVADRWWHLASGCLLPLSNGERYQLLFAGYPGGSEGPDVRDAVLVTCTPPYASSQRLTGDIEFHVRASDWEAHHHQYDPRYNRVMLHVVLICDTRRPTRRQDGMIVPLCSLQDLPQTSLETVSKQSVWPNTSVEMRSRQSVWPCHQPGNADLLRLLLRAGQLRLEQKAHAYVEQLHSLERPEAPGHRYDLCLWSAIAEGLGYGRDRALFQAFGRYLLGQEKILPAPQGEPEPLDIHRLQVLQTLLKQWRERGCWPEIARILLTSPSAPSLEGLHALRRFFSSAGLSLARTDILICNVLLPFALGVGLIEGQPILIERAQAYYSLHPGLSSNRITRLMARQLQLYREPPLSIRQQGLHYIYQQTCQEKRCELCILHTRGNLIYE
ncbi:DUF2851 family protein [Tengunoibacter tsumagoiensis]|uniref:DUF2851 domain-containing protein n=1 Tax=Tengunoibacter tsumagoiensis TaxID=2014871 RepID=A0A402A5S0_9CHLR|nr:DUF2851 family protein [Tengunoibacter tsumagoiensis]GCE14365.1 hypothetical protein KTT_42240 [Tengunoibacter tsumagoiensis]